MKVLNIVLLAAMALLADASSMASTLGNGPMAANAPSKVDSSAGSAMGTTSPTDGATTDSTDTTDGTDANAPTKPGSVPTSGTTEGDDVTSTTTKPGIPNTGAPGGGFAGGFESLDPDVANSTSSTGSSYEEEWGSTDGSDVAETTVPSPEPTSSSTALVASSVVTFVTVATATAYTW